MHQKQPPAKVATAVLFEDGSSIFLLFPSSLDEALRVVNANMNEPSIIREGILYFVMSALPGSISTRGCLGKSVDLFKFNSKSHRFTKAYTLNKVQRNNLANSADPVQYSHGFLDPGKHQQSVVKRVKSVQTVFFQCRE